MQQTNDGEIRAALHRKTLRKPHASEDTLVIDELGLAHARARIDVAVINGCVHGFEIKSSADTLNRLPRQLALYQECLEKLTIVCDSKHTRDVVASTPSWCGVLEAEKGPRGGIEFSTVRRAARNPHVDPTKLAHLLWRGEALQLLARFDASAENIRKTRKELYQAISEHLTVPQITASIKLFMASRADWRDRPAHASHGG